MTRCRACCWGADYTVIIDPMFYFILTAKDKRACTGTIIPQHVALKTPLFAPVGSQATVKALSPAHVDDLGAALALSNT